MRWKIQSIILSTVLFVSFPLVFSTFKSYAQVVDVVNTSVKISICGDFIIEGSEDCEWLDLNGQSCETLGYKSGDLFCDISCEFEEQYCIPFPPPACGDGTLDAGEECEVGNPVGSSCSWSDCDSTACRCEEEPEEPEEPEPEPGEPEEQPEKEDTNISPGYAPAIIPFLPANLRFYDIDGDGRIDISEMNKSIELWVNVWRNIVYDDSNTTCDLNSDEECNVYDFSVLLYYIES